MCTKTGTSGRPARLGRDEQLPAAQRKVAAAIAVRAARRLGRAGRRRRRAARAAGRQQLLRAEAWHRQQVAEAGQRRAARLLRAPAAPAGPTAPGPGWLARARTGARGPDRAPRPAARPARAAPAVSTPRCELLCILEAKVALLTGAYALHAAGSQQPAHPLRAPATPLLQDRSSCCGHPARLSARVHRALAHARDARARRQAAAGAGRAPARGSAGRCARPPGCRSGCAPASAGSRAGCPASACPRRPSRAPPRPPPAARPPRRWPARPRRPPARPRRPGGRRTWRAR